MKTSHNATQEERQAVLLRWMKPIDLEHELGFSIENQAQMRSKKKIPYSKVGGYVRYDRFKIDKWLEDNDMGEVK